MDANTCFRAPIPYPTGDDRLFFALFPSALEARRVAQFATDFRQRHEMRGAPLAPHRLHVTLAGVGGLSGVPRWFVDALRVAAAKVDHSAVDVAFDKIGSFGGRAGRYACALYNGPSAEPLRGLYRTLTSAIHGVTDAVRFPARFTPHMTLLYDRQRLRVGLHVRSFPWRAREIALIYSFHGRTEHRCLGRWPLAEVS